MTNRGRKVGGHKQQPQPQQEGLDFRSVRFMTESTSPKESATKIRDVEQASASAIHNLKHIDASYTAGNATVVTHEGYGMFEENDHTLNTTTTRGWTDPLLTVLGLYYPLAPCQVQLKQERLTQILRDILPTVFRQLSLDVSYQNSPIQATCRSMDHVEFELSFFANRSDDNNFNAIAEDWGMVMEISRIEGDVVPYHEYAQAILSAVSWSEEHHSHRSCDFDSAPPSATSLAACFWNGALLHKADSIFAREQRGQPMGALGFRSPSPPATSSIEHALETTWSFLSTDRYDVQRLGMESLLHMTDPYKSGLEVAQQTTESLLFPQTATQKHISQAIVECACRREDHPDATNTSSPTIDMECQFADLALAVLAQTFQVAAESKGAVDVATFLQTLHISNNNDSRKDRHHYLTLVDCLLEKVQGMHQDPHRAYFAMQSLLALCHCVPTLSTQIARNHAATSRRSCGYLNGANNNHGTLMDIVQAAHLFGNSHHLALATASQQFLLCLQQEA